MSAHLFSEGRGHKFESCRARQLPLCSVSSPRGHISSSFCGQSFERSLPHLFDARQIVERQGGESDTWVDVSETLPLLAKQRWY